MLGDEAVRCLQVFFFGSVEKEDDRMLLLLGFLTKHSQHFHHYAAHDDVIRGTRTTRNGIEVAIHHHDMIRHALHPHEDVLNVFVHCIVRSEESSRNHLMVDCYVSFVERGILDLMQVIPNKIEGAFFVSRAADDFRAF